MPSKVLYSLISKMHGELNTLIEDKKYDLTDTEVINFSKRLDRLIIRYNKLGYGNKRVSK